MKKHTLPAALVVLIASLTACNSSTLLTPEIEQPTTSAEANNIETSTPALTPIEPSQNSTETPEKIAPPLSLLEGPLISITAVDLKKGSMYLVDLATGASRRLQFDAGHPAGVQWVNDGCQLNIELDPFGTDKSVKIIHTDLQGNILDEVIQYSADDRPDTDAEHWLGRWSLSPSGEWLAYYVSSGQLFYDWEEFQDIEIVPVSKAVDPIALTDQGGVTDFAWSPDGQKIAYSEFDANGRRQLYIYNVADNEEIQLTHFDEQNLNVPDNWIEPRFNSIVWSEDSQLIAFERRFYDASFTESKGDFWIVSTAGDNQKRLFPDKALFESMVSWRGSIIGWSDDNQILAVQFHTTYSDTEQEAIYWLDTIDGAVIDQFPGDQLPSLSKAYPLDGINEIVFHHIQPVYTYDFQAGSLSQIPVKNLPNIIHARITVSPIDFPGETACRP